MAEVKAFADGRGADVILDMIGGDYIGRNFEAAAPDGRIVQIAFQGGAKATVDFRRLMLKRLTFTGSTLRSRSDAFKAALAAGGGVARLAAGRGRPAAPGDGPDLPAGGGRRRPRPHGKRRAHRQDRALA